MSVVAASMAVSIGTSWLASHLIWNATDSLPRGLYWLASAGPLERGLLVAFPVPGPVRQLVHDRRYLPDGGLLIKPIAGLPGDFVCVQGGILFVNGEAFGAILADDAEGRPLPEYVGCEKIPSGELLVAARHPRSFDSRSFGLIDTGAVRGQVRPLWTY